MKQFSIKKVSAEPDRPPYSYKLDEYFEDFVIENILKPSNLVIDEWKVILSIMIFCKEPDSPEGVSFYEPDIVKEDKLKIYPVAILLEDIYRSADHVNNIAGLYFQIISLFFLAEYKTISREFLLTLKEKIDWSYLHSLPYPAAAEEQKYVGEFPA